MPVPPRPPITPRTVGRAMAFRLGLLGLVAGGMLACSLLVWPVLLALHAVTRCCLIPHAPGTYVFLSGPLTYRLWDFPTDYMAFGVVFIDVPVGFIIIGWFLFLFTASLNGWEAWRRLPKRKRTLRRQRQVELARRAAKVLLLGTCLFLAFAFPFMRCYEILTDDALLVRHALDWNERVYPLSRLKEIRRTVSGKGLIGWDVAFDDGASFSMHAPSREALARLLARPHVRANVRIVDGRLELLPDR